MVNNMSTNIPSDISPSSGRWEKSMEEKKNELHHCPYCDWEICSQYRKAGWERSAHLSLCAHIGKKHPQFSRKVYSRKDIEQAKQDGIAEGKKMERKIVNDKIMNLMGWEKESDYDRALEDLKKSLDSSQTEGGI